MINSEGNVQSTAAKLSKRLNIVVEAIVACLMALLVVDVWIGVVDRYIFHWQFPWPEILARYLMIWAALLAISCGIARREHIGLVLLISKFPPRFRRISLILMDIISFFLFMYVFLYGIGFGLSGFKREAMIFGMSLGPAYLAVPVSAFVASVQVVLVSIRDLGDHGIVSEMDNTMGAR